ncbi:MAG: response regulator transcription factor [Lachnospiraceae bacterium]|nr:response regulator transcription factor [Lachnospiraceae bacterium]MBP3609663.1 response regulator transcription factor [Lachnospiraceae bacterium]
MTIRQKALIAEDDRAYGEELSRLLSEKGYEVLLAHTGAEALRMTTSHCPEVVLLNLTLPDMDGMSILGEIRSWSVMPVIIISQSAEEADIVRALDSGADDYVTRQCGPQELLARIRAAIRHTRTGSGDLQFANEGKIVVGSLTIDYNKYRVYVGGEDAGLTQNEFRLVALLGKYAGNVLTYERIMKELWGPNAGGDNQVLRVNMTSIRRKIKEIPGEPKYIHTENGIGYRMISREEAAELEAQTS